MVTTDDALFHEIPGEEAEPHLSDHDLSNDLKPYARSCIVGEIERFFRDKLWMMRVSRHDQELLLRAKQARADLTVVLGRLPADVQVAAQLDVSTDDLRHAYQAHEGGDRGERRTGLAPDRAGRTAALSGR